MSVITGLFDPFYANHKDGAWKRSATQHTDSCTIIAEHAVEEIEGLANQFASGVAGWRAVLMQVPGFNHRPYLLEAQQNIFNTLIRTKLKPGYTCTLYMLPDDRVIALLHMENVACVADFCREATLILRPEGDTRPATTRMFDLSRANTDFLNLCRDITQQFATKIEILPSQPGLSTEQLITFALTSNQKSLRHNREGLHVLVVEDDAATSALLVQLVNQKHTVSSAFNAVDAVTEYRHSVPDLVLLDIGLPDISGLELLQRMVEGDAEACVVMLTANAFKTNIEKALSHGAKGFMAKPFNRERLGYYLDLATKLKKERA